MLAGKRGCQLSSLGPGVSPRAPIASGRAAGCSKLKGVDRRTQAMGRALARMETGTEVVHPRFRGTQSWFIRSVRERFQLHENKSSMIYFNN